MLELSLKTASGDISAFKKIVSDGISEERKKIEQITKCHPMNFCSVSLMVKSKRMGIYSSGGPN